MTKPAKTPPTLTLLTDNIGAVISGIDVNHLNEANIAFIHAALLEHLVVFFRNQTLDPTNLRTLASRFGTPIPYPFVEGLPNLPEVIEVVKKPEDTLNFGGVWHSDTAYLSEPAMGAWLYAVEVPEHGGDTIFTNMYDVFSSLSPGLKRWLRSLAAVNDADSNAIAATRRTSPKKRLAFEHPVVRTHPETGRELLYINRAHTTRFSDMTIAESKPLLDYLCHKIEAPEFSCRFHWEAGSLAFWDNRACQHYPLNDYQGKFRHMLRVSLKGDAPR
ncbi:MAG: taurine dioxygenase [Candidatus Azotimanducaceae bacterium]|jgi:taurine dioxygenase